MKPSFTILVYCDGAVRGNGKAAGCMGAGAVLLNVSARDVLHRRELSWQIAEERNTNQRAELYAIRNAVQSIKEASRAQTDLTVISDSEWAIRSIEGRYRATVHLDLIEEVRELMVQFRSFRFEWIRGHAGASENERADELAVAAAGSARK